MRFYLVRKQKGQQHFDTMAYSDAKDLNGVIGGFSEWAKHGKIDATYAVSLKEFPSEDELLKTLKEPHEN